MGLYKTKFSPSVVLALMCLNDFLCLPRVLLSAGVKRSLTGTAINPFKILHRFVSLKFFLLVCKSVQPRSWIRTGSCLLRNVQQLFEFCLKAHSQANTSSLFLFKLCYTF